MYGKYDFAKYAILKNIPSESSISYDEFLGRMNTDLDCIWLSGALSIRNELSWFKRIGLIKDSDSEQLTLTVDGKKIVNELRSLHASR